jgi:VIT1/CCC1 family predicted Fe2+/Mn2+ transporter
LPLLVIMSPVAVRAPACFVAVLVALAITGAMSARLGGAKVARATIRTVAGGALAMAVTYGVGHVLGVAL